MATVLTRLLCRPWLARTRNMQRDSQRRVLFVLDVNLRRPAAAAAAVERIQLVVAPQTNTYILCSENGRRGLGAAGRGGAEWGKRGRIARTLHTIS